MRIIDANEVVKNIVAERDKIPRTVSTAPYELGTEKPYHAGDQMRGGIRKALRCIEQAPTVDAVPVVRCRECIAYTPVDDNTGKCVFLIGKHQYVVPDGYCYLGERKEGADNR